MPQLSAPALAFLVMNNALPDAGLSSEADTEQRVRPPRDLSAYSEVSVSKEFSPYGEFEVPRVPWSHGVSYRGMSALDLRAQALRG